MRRVALVVVVAAALAVGLGLRYFVRDYQSARGATVDRFTLHSPLAHRDLHEILVVPEGGGRGASCSCFCTAAAPLRPRTSGSRCSTRFTHWAGGRR